MNKVYVYSKCNTCRNALKWLKEKGLNAELINIDSNPPTINEIRKYHIMSGKPLKSFFNTSGMVYRELNLKGRIDQLDEEELYKLLSSNGMLIKRPLLIFDNKILIGFKEKQWETIL
ncbi:arsenate reductase family protein [Spirochaeta cellobiosiphila]|uniref:arsenate reductase family protein n=1 Tax=Spirochaeta cellobiosiphila TaxID=504483 RepID=UPI0004012214|nr:arsenate reductase family protein [Spirochaeta cellobiosiphila]